MQITPNRLALLLVGGLALAGIIVALSHSILQATPPNTSSSVLPATIAIDPNVLEAQAAILYDPETHQVLFSKNAEEQLPLASLTKLMSAETALSNITATSTVKITNADVATVNDAGDMQLKPGQIWNAKQLIEYSLIVSSNDGMAAVAQSLGGSAFIQSMNTEAKNLGLAQSYFLNPSGLDLTQSTSGGYGSAYDVAILTADFYQTHPSVFEETLRPEATFAAGEDELHGIPTARPLLSTPQIIGAKTGYTELAGGNLVTVFDVSLGHPLVGVVLHSTDSGRFQDMETLIAAARSALQT